MKVKKGLFLNIKKTKIMDIDKCKKEARIAIHGEEIERVSNFEYMYLGARIEANGKSTPEIRRSRASNGNNTVNKNDFYLERTMQKNKTESPRDSGIPNCLV